MEPWQVRGLAVSAVYLLMPINNYCYIFINEHSFSRFRGRGARLSLIYLSLVFSGRIGRVPHQAAGYRLAF